MTLLFLCLGWLKRNKCKKVFDLSSNLFFKKDEKEKKQKQKQDIFPPTIVCRCKHHTPGLTRSNSNSSSKLELNSNWQNYHC